MRISVCIPVYNVAPYIRRCAVSLFSQTCSDVEFIFVDDGSTDDSISILNDVIRQFPERNGQIRIISHPVNRGLAVARKTAVLASAGDYISIVDSDDWVEPSFLDTLLRKALDDDADITTCDFLHEGSDGPFFLEKAYYGSLSGIPFDDVVTERIGFTIWNKLYRRSLWFDHDCFSPEGLDYGEDRYSVMRLSFFANRISHTDAMLYHYNKSNPRSFTACHTPRHFASLVRYWSDMDSFLEAHSLSQKYADIIAYQKVFNKSSLMLSASSNSIRKSYAGPFRDEEKTHMSRLHGGHRVIEFLVFHRLWPLVSAYCFYAQRIYPLKQRLLHHHHQ